MNNLRYQSALAVLYTLLESLAAVPSPYLMDYLRQPHVCLATCHTCVSPITSFVSIEY